MAWPRLFRHAVIIAGWIGVVVLAAALRFEHLADRPLHCDEATGARITSWRMEPDRGYHFDPAHFHGPLLSALAAPWCAARGETNWRTLTKGTLRALPALAGSLLVLVPILGRRRWGDGPMLLAAALSATSPLLVYYSRMFIHESLLVLTGMLTLFVLLERPRWGLPGVCFGLMFATKESCVISLLAWAGAAGAVALGHRRAFDRTALLAAWRRWRLPVAASLATAAATALVLYTDWFRAPRGALDAVRTFFVYQTVDGHDKPFPYYLELLLVPKQAAGHWWFETPVLVLALIGCAAGFRHHPPAAGASTAVLVRFLACATAGHFLIYSLIAYKTPWLACLPWAHVCLLAGCAVAAPPARRPLRWALVAVAVLALASQVIQTRRATGRLASDERNPYAYVPTSEDLETLGPWLDELATTAPDHRIDPVGVVGTGYWPLPWYLRQFQTIGYWPTPPANLAQLPLVFAVPETTDAVAEQLAATHTPVLRGLRAEVPLSVFIRNDIWIRWMARDKP